MRSIRWGIIAPGKIANKFAADFCLIPNHIFTAVASTDLSRAAAFAQKFGIPKFYGKYDEMLENENLDVVYISSPHVFHFEQAKMCLDMGVSVLCEKPVTVNSAQLIFLIDLAKRKKLFFMEALWTVFNPAIRKIIELIDGGEIGKIVGVKADFGFHSVYDPSSRLYDPNLAGGSLLDIGIYPLLLANLCLGEPSEISALASITPSGIDDDLMAILKYKEGALAHIHSSFRYNTRSEAFIYGEKGTIWIPNRWIDSQNFYLLKNEGSSQLFNLPWEGFGFQFQVLEVEKCLLSGKLESALAPPSLSLRLSQQMDEIRRQIGVIYPADRQS